MEEGNDGQILNLGWDNSQRILQKRQPQISCIEFFVVGNKPGKYILNCRIMCSEYMEPMEQEIEVSVIAGK